MTSTSVFQFGLGCVAAAGFIKECAKGADSYEALHTRNLERQWATSSSTEYQDGGHKPEVVITARFSDNNVIHNLRLGSLSRQQHFFRSGNGQYIFLRLKATWRQNRYTYNFAPDPTERAYSAPPDTLAGLRDTNLKQ